MYRNIGINLDKETYAILKHRKTPYLNHSTRLGYNQNQFNNSWNSNESTASQDCCKNNMNIEFCVNGHEYKIDKKNLMAVGLGALVTLSAYKAYKFFTDV